LLLTPKAFILNQSLIQLLCLISIFSVSCLILRQTDIKKIIAYSSIIHMNVGILGLTLNNIIGLTGSTLMGISHGFISGALFTIAGILYNRYKTRDIKYYLQGTQASMPKFTILFF